GSIEQVQYVAEIVAGFGVRRPDRKRLLVLRNRLVQSAERLHRIAEVVVELGDAGLEHERLFVMTDRFLRTVEARERKPEIMMRIGGILVRLGCAAEQTRGIVEFRLLQAKQPQSVESTEMTVVCLEHDCEQLLRL